MILPSGCFDFNRFDEMTLSEIESYVPRRYGSLFPECVGKEGAFDWVGFEESFPEEMAQLAMRMKGFMSGYHTYRLRGGAYRLSHPKLVALFEWVHQDFMDEVSGLMRTQQLNVQAEAGCIMPDSHLYGPRGWRWAEFEWRDMAVQFSAALLLEVVWRESILSETLLQMMPPPIVMASRELHDLHEGGETKEAREVEAWLAKGEFTADLGSMLAKKKEKVDRQEKGRREIRAWLAKEEFKAVLDSMLAKKKHGPGSGCAAATTAPLNTALHDGYCPAAEAAKAAGAGITTNVSNYSDDCPYTSHHGNCTEAAATAAAAADAGASANDGIDSEGRPEGRLSAWRPEAANDGIYSEGCPEGHLSGWESEGRSDAQRCPGSSYACSDVRGHGEGGDAVLSLSQRAIGDDAPHTFVSVTDANDSLGGALLQRGWICHGHGGKGDLIQTTDFPPPPLASPERCPRCDSLTDFTAIRTPDVLILQLAAWDQLRTFLAVIQPGIVTTLVILLRAAEVTMGAGAVKEIVSAVKQSGPTVSMSSCTLALQALGYPSTGAWTAILVWSTAGDAQHLLPTFSDIPSEHGRSVSERLGDAFGDVVTVDVFEPAPKHHPSHRAWSRVVKAGRVRIRGAWYTVFSPLGQLPAPDWLDRPPLLRRSELIVGLDAVNVARLFDLSARPSSPVELLWLALPGAGAALVANVLEPFTHLLRYQRRRPGVPGSFSRRTLHHQARRPPLRGGKWWCVDPGCATCKTLEATTGHRSKVQSLAQSFLSLTFRVFLRVLKTDFVNFVKTVEEERLAECTRGFRQVMRAYKVNYYGGCFQYDDSTKTRVVWVPKLLRRLVFWRWPTEVRWGLLKGFNPGFDYADIEPLGPGGNYASMSWSS